MLGFLVEVENFYLIKMLVLISFFIFLNMSKKLRIMDFLNLLMFYYCFDFLINL